MEILSQEIHKKINWLDRIALENILTSISIECYGYESDDDLRDAIRENISDGTLDPSVLDD